MASFPFFLLEASKIRRPLKILQNLEYGLMQPGCKNQAATKTAEMNQPSQE
jgi:hypothetical protein